MAKLICILLCVHLAYVHSVDKTVEPHARGEDVVDAVIDKIRSKCLFPDDKYFMRRLAAVQTDYGNNMNPGDGGIWKVTNTMIIIVKIKCRGNLRSICNSVQDLFSVDLTTVTLAEMDLPLKSGLLMRVVIMAFTPEIQASISAQANLWLGSINKYGRRNEFITKAPIQADCSDVKMDLVFVIDASGSVGYTSFQKTLTFLKQVVGNLTIGTNLVRVAVIRFASSAAVSFDLDRYDHVSDIKRDITRIKYTRGGTNTANALKLTSQVFKKARQNVPKVLVLITDGRSNSYPLTVAAADILKKESITIFTIGIGRVNKREMLAVASDLNCTHFFSLKSYSEIDTIINEIQRESCVAPVIVTPTDGVVNDTQIDNNPIPSDNKTKAQTIVIDSNQNPANQNNQQNTTTVKVDVVCGIVDVYVSITVTNPNSATHDDKSRAIDDSPAWIRVDSKSKLYVTLSSQRRTDLMISKCTNPHYNISINPANTSTTVICRENGIDRICADGDIKESFGHLFGNPNQCPVKDIQNPCTNENILNNTMRFPYPNRSNMYIQCKIAGGMEIVTCPTGTKYSKLQSICGPHITACPPGSVPYTGPNPCTREAIMKKKFYFENPSDSSSFIQCDEWQNAFLVYCGKNTIWSQKAYTCVHVSSLSPSFNPCNSSTNVFYYANPADETSFIQCDESGSAFIQFCPATTVWSQAYKTCIHGSCSGCSSSSSSSSSSTSSSSSSTCSTIGEYFADPQDTNSFYQCASGNIRKKKKCPSGLVWSQAKKVCDWP